MAKKGLLVSADEQIRYESVQSHLQGEISLLELAAVLKLTEGQTYRVVAKVKKKSQGSLPRKPWTRTGKQDFSIFKETCAGDRAYDLLRLQLSAHARTPPRRLSTQYQA